MYHRYTKHAKWLRESWCPSATVDENGNLYTLTFSAFDEAAKGPSFKLEKFVAGTTYIQSSYSYCYIWYEYTKDSITFSFSNKPNTSQDSRGSVWFYNMAHNLFSPILAQESFPDKTSNTDYLYIFSLLPPVRWGNPINSQSDCEGFVGLKMKKSNLELAGKMGHGWGDENRLFGLDGHMVRATVSNYSQGLTYMQPVTGFVKAVFDGTRVQVYHIANRPDGGDWQTSATKATQLYNRIYDPQSLKLISNGEVSGISSVTADGMILYPRFQRIGNSMFFGATCSGYNTNLGVFENNSAKQKLLSQYCTYVENGNATSTHARYQQDFCVIQNGNQRIACFLGLKSAQGQSDLSSSQGWSSSGINWEPKNLACILYSTPISNDTIIQTLSSTTDLKTYPQNVIYTVPIARGAGIAVNSQNLTASDDKRLYLNTQMFVSYTSSSNRYYFIYAYCYPGKTSQLFFGCAPYHISQDNHVYLETLYEFRSPNGETFGDFTNCSRIITMDLKDDHLWITFMNKDSTAYHYFHVKASDLIRGIERTN